jgi:hypothetical protein
VIAVCGTKVARDEWRVASVIYRRGTEDTEVLAAKNTKYANIFFYESILFFLQP